MSYFKHDPFEFNQDVLFPKNIFDLLSKDHECYIYEDLFNQVDTSEVEKNYSVKGQHAYHPRLILGILVYAYSHDIFSSREIEKKCSEDLGFMYVSHMSCPNFRVLSDFRKDNYEFFKLFFSQTVLLAKEAGLVNLGHVSLDGSKFKADTSKHKAMSYKRLKELEKQLRVEIEELLMQADRCDSEEDAEYGELSGYEVIADLKIKEKRLEKIREAKAALEKRELELHPGKEIDAKKQISFADQEAMIMGKKGSFDYCYNGQISVDKSNQIIVGEHLSRNANDKREVAPALKEIKSTTGTLPEKMSLDNGYMSGDNLEDLCETGIDVYMATGKGEGDNNSSESEEGKGKFKKSNFTYDVDSDTFQCPAGKILKLKSQSRDGKKEYQAEKAVCIACGLRAKCCKSTKGEARTIHTDDKEPLRQEMKDKMSQACSKEIYKERKVIVEPVFGQIKNGGFRRFHLRGYNKARGEFSLVCSVHNIKKIVKAIFRGVVCLEAGKLVKNGC
jgi:transposase